jgi:hypothetical protein
MLIRSLLLSVLPRNLTDPMSMVCQLEERRPAGEVRLADKVEDTCGLPPVGKSTAHAVANETRRNNPAAPLEANRSKI